MTRAVLGGSGRQVSRVGQDSGKRTLLTPRLALLVCQAEALKVYDLALLTGEQKFSSATCGRSVCKIFV